MRRKCSYTEWRKNRRKHSHALCSRIVGIIRQKHVRNEQTFSNMCRHFAYNFHINLTQTKQCCVSQNNVCSRFIYLCCPWIRIWILMGNFIGAFSWQACNMPSYLRIKWRIFRLASSHTRHSQTDRVRQYTHTLQKDASFIAFRESNAKFGQTNLSRFTVDVKPNASNVWPNMASIYLLLEIFRSPFALLRRFTRNSQVTRPTPRRSAVAVLCY